MQNSERLKKLCEEQHAAHDAMRQREQQLRADIARLQKDMAHMNAAKMKACYFFHETFAFIVS